MLGAAREGIDSIDSLTYQQLFRYAEDIHVLLEQQKQLEQRSQNLENDRIDNTTGLPRWDMIVEQSEVILSGAEEVENILVITLNVSGLRKINNAFGRSMGDQVLHFIGHRLRQAVQSGDVVARVDGDEFVIVTKLQYGLAEKSILKLFEPPLIMDGHEIFIALSMGGAYLTHSDNDLLATFRKASIALGIAKNYRLHHICVYTKEMELQCSRESMMVDTDIWHAMQRKELYLLYQPRVSTRDSRIFEGVEALLRWTHPLLGNIPPSRFIHAAEINGAIIPIGAWVLKKSCQQLQTWRANGIKNATMAVNVSPHQLRSDTFLDMLKSTLEETDVSPESLELEIIESEIDSSFDLIKDVLTTVRDWGVRIAIDDFGTGHSNLSRLKDFPVTRLKIDRSLISDLDVDARSHAIVLCIMSLASALGADVVAEGVESNKQFEQLQKLNCHYAQGYLIGSPMNSDEILYWIASNQRKRKINNFFALFNHEQKRTTPL